MTTDQAFREQYDALQSQWRQYAIEERRTSLPALSST